MATEQIFIKPIFPDPVIIDNAGNDGDYTFAVLTTDLAFLNSLGLDRSTITYPGVINPEYTQGSDTFVTLLAKDNTNFIPGLTSNTTFVNALASSVNLAINLNKNKSFIPNLTGASFGREAFPPGKNAVMSTTVWLSGFSQTFRVGRAATLFNKLIGSAIDITNNLGLSAVSETASFAKKSVDPLNAAISFKEVTANEIPESMWVRPFTASSLFSIDAAVKDNTGLHNYFFNNSSFIYNLSANNIISDTLSSLNISGNFLKIEFGEIISLSATNVSAAWVSATSGFFDNLSSTFLASINNIFEAVTAVTLSSHLAIIDNLTAINLSSQNILADNSSIQNLSATNAEILSISSISIFSDSISSTSLSSSSIITDAATINNNLTVTGNISSQGDLRIDGRIFGEVVGPTVSIGDTADLLELIAIDSKIENLSATQISALSISANNTIINTLSSTDGIFDNITIIGDSDRSRLTVIQKSSSDVAQFYFNDSCIVGETSSIALVIKGAGCHTEEPDLYRGGFVGIRTENPNEALTVRGNISADNIFTDGILKGAVVEAGVATVDTLNVLETGSIKDLASDTIFSRSIRVEGDLIVTGSVTGGSLSSSDTQSNENTIVTNLTATSLSARFIETERGNSDLWNAAYFTPTVINLVLNGGESFIKHGAKGYIEIPYNIRLSSWDMFADIPSSISAVMYILSSTYESYPDSISLCSDLPAIDIGDVKNSSNSLNTWLTELSAGTVLHFGVCGMPIPGGYADLDSKLLTLSLKGVKY